MIVISFFIAVSKLVHLLLSSFRVCVCGLVVSLLTVNGAAESGRKTKRQKKMKKEEKKKNNDAPAIRDGLKSETEGGDGTTKIRAIQLERGTFDGFFFF